MKKEVVFLSTCCSLLVTVSVGCVSEYNIATGKQETILYSTEKEVRIGESIAKKVEEEFEVVEDEEMNMRLEEIASRIVEVCDRKEIEYSFKIIEEKEKKGETVINAFALPGGFIYVYKDLMEVVRSDDELAGVLAHELGHVVAKHSIKKLQAAMGYMLIRIAAAAATDPSFGQGIDIAFQQVLLGYGREDEILADRLAAKYMELAGYKPEKMIGFLRFLREFNQKQPLRKFSYNRTHPYIAERIIAVKRQIGIPLDFDDLVNQ